MRLLICKIEGEGTMGCGCVCLVLGRIHHIAALVRCALITLVGGLSPPREMALRIDASDLLSNSTLNFKASHLLSASMSLTLQSCELYQILLLDDIFSTVGLMFPDFFQSSFFTITYLPTPPKRI